MTHNPQREQVKLILRRMSPWQLHLLLKHMGEPFDELRSTFMWILLNPWRGIMWSSSLLRGKPWLWFGVK